MNTQRKEFNDPLFAAGPQFSYIPDSDKYLFAPSKPAHKFNVIGIGVNGLEHIRVTLLEGRAAIHGIYDPNRQSVEVAQRLFSQYNPKASLVVYDSLQAACTDPAVDGLIIATPNYTHLEVVKEAAKSGKNILLEKPMATNVRDAYEIWQLAEKYSAHFQVGLQYRYKPIYAESVHEALERKTLGEIKTITILEHRMPFLDKVKQWNKFSKYSGGTLVEKCCHYFDLFNLFAQARPVNVYASGSQAVNFRDYEYNGEKSDIIDNAMVTVQYENGVRANFNLCMFAPMFYEEFILCGDAGRLKAYENEDFIPVERPHSYLEVMCGPEQPSRISYPTYPTYIAKSGHHGGTFYEHVNFINALEGKQTSAAKASEGFWSIVVGAAAEESVKTGVPVAINELLKRNGLSL